MLARFRADVPSGMTPEEIEAEITANWEKYRAERVGSRGPTAGPPVRRLTHAADATFGAVQPFSGPEDFKRLRRACEEEQVVESHREGRAGDPE